MFKPQKSQKYAASYRITRCSILQFYDRIWLTPSLTRDMFRRREACRAPAEAISDGIADSE